MPSPKDIPGRKSGKSSDPRKRNTSYFENQKKSEYQDLFFSFRNQLVVPGVETYGHEFSLVILNNHPTVNVDDGILNIATTSWKEGHVSGHMKDVVSAEEAAYYDLCEDVWCLFGQLRNEWAAVTQLDNPTFADTTPTTATAHVFLKPTSFNTLVESLSLRNTVVPVWLVSLLKMFTGLHCELFKAYEIYGTAIPSIDMVYGIRDGDLADLETLRDSLTSHKGDAVQHMNKFGISYVKFEESMIKDVTELVYDSPKWWIISQMFGFRMRAKAAGSAVFAQEITVASGGFDAGVDWSTWAMYLKDGQMSEEIIFSMIFGEHHATNNNYGGLFDWNLNASEGDCACFLYPQDATAVVLVDAVNTDTHRWLLFNGNPFVGDDDFPQAGWMDMVLAGTELTANMVVMNNDARINPFHHDLLRTKKTVSKSILESFLIRKVINMSSFK